ncbi:MAG: PhoH family protein [Fuerstiella sp.]
MAVSVVSVNFWLGFLWNSSPKLALNYALQVSAIARKVGESTMYAGTTTGEMNGLATTETSLQLHGQSEAQSLFGPQDDYLRRARRVTGATILLRGNVVEISGSADSVDRCEHLLRTWLRTLRTNSELLESDVARTLDDKDEGEFLDNEFLDISGSGAPMPATAVIPRSREIQAARMGKDKVSGVKPKTEGQRLYMKAMNDHPLVLCDGPAGCGKTYLAVALALQALRDEEVRKIVLVRPAVEAGEKLGFLPGDMFAKVNPFVRPLLDAMHDMLDFDQVRRYIANDVIEIAPLAFMRGRTLNDTFMILDEGQNTTITQMKMFLTRMGINSRIVVTGDATQNDLPKGVTSGLRDGIRRLSGIEGVAIVKLSGQDIVRHRLVREIVSAYEADGVGSEAS